MVRPAMTRARTPHQAVHRLLAAIATGGLVLLAAAAAAAAAQAASGDIYTCIDSRGNRLTSDRPIPECNDRDQRVLNRDGSVKTVRPPPMNAEERAEADARERKANEARLAQAEYVRRDRNLMQRYRDEAAHQKARQDALVNIRKANERTWARFDELIKERKPLNDEMEFYVNRPPPPALKMQIEANDASLAAVTEAVKVQQVEIARLNRQYDAELERLRRLWAGAPAGSMGPLVVPAAPEPSATDAPVRPGR